MTQPPDDLWMWADWPAPKKIRAGTSLRFGGCSRWPYQDLNLALHVGDLPENVIKNRKILTRHLSLPTAPVWLEQIHGAKIISIDAGPENFSADGSYTTQQNKVCAVMTADCVPILFCDVGGTQIGAIHAGWRGICCGIIEKAVQAFSRPASLQIWIGPCISSQHYIVGKAVYEQCLAHSIRLKSAFHQINTDHWYCDLVKIVKIILKKSGVDSIHESGLCTYTEDSLFYSYRRDGKTGRMATMIWMA